MMCPAQRETRKKKGEEKEEGRKRIRKRGGIGKEMKEKLTECNKGDTDCLQSHTTRPHKQILASLDEDKNLKSSRKSHNVFGE